MARKKSSGSPTLWLILLGIILIAMIPKEVWVVLGFLGGGWLGIYLLGKYSKRNALIQSSPEEKRIDVEGTLRVPDSSVQNSVTVGFGDNVIIEKTKGAEFKISAVSKPIGRSSNFDGRGTVAEKADGRSDSDLVEKSGFKIPLPPEKMAHPRWYGADESIEVSGKIIRGGLLYVGYQEDARGVESDPSLINLSKPVSRQGDFTARLTDYWPSYSLISSEARAAYLSWLCDGRRHPDVDIGFVFIFFYGLERRVLVDAKNDESVRNEFPAIRRELEELLSVYGARSGSFLQYGKGLLGLVQAWVGTEKLYLHPLPEMQRGYDTPMPVRIALGQASIDRYPVPSHLAISWVECCPERYLRTPATRCVIEFRRLFEVAYAQKFGAGMVLPKNKTKLKINYRPASSGLRGLSEVTLIIGDLPDVTVLTKPINELWLLSEEVTAQLETYSRYLGRNPDSRGTVDSYVLLPVCVWPEIARNVLVDLKNRSSTDGVLVLSLSEMMLAFGASSVLPKERFVALCGALRSAGISIEPDVSMGARVPKFEDKIALFPTMDGEIFQETPAYKSALLTLQLASVVAMADGSFCSNEFNHLQMQIEKWNHLTKSQVQRLAAHLHILQQTPISLVSLKKKLEVLDEDTKEIIACFMTKVAQADGAVSVAEVKILEKIYAALGIESKRVFSDIHSVSSGVIETTKPNAKTTGFVLDTTKIQELQKDTENVTALLSKIFSEEDVVVSQVPPIVDDAVPEEQPIDSRFLNLDESHASFARHLLTRKEWARAELQDTASDLDLMLDGALEQINDASWDVYDLAFTEGDDPISVNPEVLEKIAA